ncbi:MAG: adenylyltransferase/cytidyltransferase family protein [Candidatus Sungiibacteriota bacterium]
MRKRLLRFLSKVSFSYDRMRMILYDATKKVMVFGVFDGLHEGHRYFLAMAREQGDELIAVVARDEVVRVLKNKTPRHSEEERRRAVAQLLRLSLNSEAKPQLTDASRAVLGDRVLGAYDVIKKYKPDVICLGYDQHALAEDLEKKMQTGVVPVILIRRIAAHKKKF